MTLAIVYGLKAFKKGNGGFLSLGEGLKTGLAISLVAGAIVSTLLTLIVVPLIYYITERKKWEK